MDWFTGGKKCFDGLKKKELDSTDHDGMWNVSESNWTNIPAGLRQGYDIPALYRDIQNTNS